MSSTIFNEDGTYFNNRKPFDAFVSDTFQETFERKLDYIINSRDTEPEVDLRSEVKEMVCAPRRRRGGYFNNGNKKSR